METDGGLWSEMTYAGAIRRDKWARAIATGEVIGTCRVCGGFLVPNDPGWPEASTIDWYIASCLDCGHEVAAPGGRILMKRGSYGR